MNVKPQHLLVTRQRPSWPVWGYQPGWGTSSKAPLRAIMGSQKDQQPQEEEDRVAKGGSEGAPHLQEAQRHCPRTCLSSPGGSPEALPTPAISLSMVSYLQSDMV